MWFPNIWCAIQVWIHKKYFGVSNSEWNNIKRCLNCKDYDLCEDCEIKNEQAATLHDKDHLFLKINQPIDHRGVLKPIQPLKEVLDCKDRSAIHVRPLMTNCRPSLWRSYVEPSDYKSDLNLYWNQNKPPTLLQQNPNMKTPHSLHDPFFFLILLCSFVLISQTLNWNKKLN